MALNWKKQVLPIRLRRQTRHKLRAVVPAVIMGIVAVTLLVCVAIVIKNRPPPEPEISQGGG